EYGQEVFPAPRTVTPRPITIAPDPFAIKIDAVTTLDAIQGSVRIVGGNPLLENDTVIVHGEGATANLTGDASSGTQTNAAPNIKVLTVTGTTGSFTLTDGTDTAVLDVNATASAIKAALEGFRNIGKGHVTVDATAAAHVWEIGFDGIAGIPALRVSAG